MYVIVISHRTNGPSVQCADLIDILLRFLYFLLLNYTGLWNV